MFCLTSSGVPLKLGLNVGCWREGERGVGVAYWQLRARANGYLTQAPEIQTMYSLNIPVAKLRTKMRQEFERHRYVKQPPVVDTLLFKSHAEFQVREISCTWGEESGDIWTGSWHLGRIVASRGSIGIGGHGARYVKHTEYMVGHKDEQPLTLKMQETMNFWKQLPHLLKYFRAEEEPSAQRPKNFINGFLEVCCSSILPDFNSRLTLCNPGTQLNACLFSIAFVHISNARKPFQKKLLYFACRDAQPNVLCFMFPSFTPPSGC